MSTYNDVSLIIEDLVKANPTLVEAIDTSNPAWIDVGIPIPSTDPNAVFPCVRLDGLTQSAGKWNTYTLNVHLWSQDCSVAFYDLADDFATALQSSNQILCESYLDRPETGLSSVLIPVTFMTRPND